MSSRYETPNDVAQQIFIAREVLRKHGSHKASLHLLPAFLFLLEKGKVKFEVDNYNDVWWSLKEEGE